MNVVQPDGTVIILGKEQEDVVHAAVHAIRSGKMLYQYSAPAGCGKSVVLRAIVQELGYDEDEIAPMAYTGAAAMVMKHNGFWTAKTCHSWLYAPVIKEEYDPDLHKYIKVTTFVWKPMRDDIKLILIDEASMIDTTLRMDIEKNHIPVIACGDLDQLPPIGGKSAYLNTAIERVDRLTKIMRQEANSAIVLLSRFIRSGGEPKVGSYGEVEVIDLSQLSSQMLLRSEIIICGYNHTRDEITRGIRNSLGFRTDLPTSGEKIVCRENNWDITVDDVNMVNGMIGRCENLDGSISNLDERKGKIIFRLNFRPLLFPNIVFTNVAADYQYFISDQNGREKIKAEERRSKWLRRRRANKFEFGYVITTHMSQGSQYNSGVYISQRFRDSIQPQLDYTGITRFKHHCIYVLPTSFTARYYPPKGRVKPMNKVVMYINDQPQI